LGEWVKFDGDLNFSSGNPPPPEFGGFWIVKRLGFPIIFFVYLLGSLFPPNSI